MGCVKLLTSPAGTKPCAPLSPALLLGSLESSVWSLGRLQPGVKAAEWVWM